MTLTTVARIPYETSFGLGGHIMPESESEQKPALPPNEAVQNIQLTVRKIWEYLINNPLPTLILVTGFGYFVLNKVDALTSAIDTRLNASIGRLDASVNAANLRVDLVTNKAVEFSSQTAEMKQVRQSLSDQIASATTEISQVRLSLSEKIGSATTEISHVRESLSSLDGEIKASVGRLQSAKSPADMYIESFGIKLDQYLLAATYHGRTLVFPLQDFKIPELRKHRFFQTDFGFKIGSTKYWGWAPSRNATRNPPRILDPTTLKLPSAYLSAASYR